MCIRDRSEGRGHFAKLLGARVDGLRPGLRGHDGRVDGGAHVLDDPSNLFGGPCDAVGELANLVGDHRESPSALACAGCLDARVDRENVGLFRQLVDELEDAAGLLRFLSELEHVADDEIDLPLDAGDPLLRPLHGEISLSRSSRRLLRDA